MAWESPYGHGARHPKSKKPGCCRGKLRWSRDGVRGLRPTLPLVPGQWLACSWRRYGHARLAGPLTACLHSTPPATSHRDPSNHCFTVGSTRTDTESGPFTKNAG